MVTVSDEDIAIVNQRVPMAKLSIYLLSDRRDYWVMQELVRIPKPPMRSKLYAWRMAKLTGVRSRDLFD